MNKLKKIFLYLQVVKKLGLNNVLYIIYYRFSLKSGLRKKRFPVSTGYNKSFFKAINKASDISENFSETAKERGEAILKGKFTFFHHHQFNLNPIPDWFYDPFSGKRLQVETQEKHWTEINEFDLNTGDIKNLWELSRFDWLTDLARAYAVTKEQRFLDQINLLLADWSGKNPVNLGVNWRCGQETSIRVMKLFQTAMILEQLNNITDSLWKWVYVHLERINGNIRYAVAQDNNHGTSEAAVLYIGAVWLLHQTKDANSSEIKTLNRFKKRGRKILENRINHLILPQGTFSQKSVNYHRVVIDTMSFVLFAQYYFSEPGFSLSIQKRLKEMGLWLLEMTESETGAVPFSGSNDGAMFETLHSLDYTDYRPSLQLFFALLLEMLLWKKESLYEVLFWRGINPENLKPYDFDFNQSRIRDREFIRMAAPKGEVIVRVKATQDNFRPGNDVMHLDLWSNGKNLFLDSGSYSYNSDLSNYFRSLAAHNTLQFGDFEPMPRLSRFLNGRWIKVEHKNDIINTNQSQIWSGKYQDYQNNTHIRQVVLYDDGSKVEVSDSFSGREGEVKTLRFHLPFDFESHLRIVCTDANEKILEPVITRAPHSQYYNSKAEHLVYSFQQSIAKGVFKTQLIINS